RWATDTSGQARRLAKLALLEYLRQVLAEDFDPAAKFARASLDSKRITNALLEVQDQRCVQPNDLDRDPWALNFLNGTVDLRTGELRAHNRADCITKIIHHNFNPTAECLRFMRFLEEITGGGPDAAEGTKRSTSLMDYLQLAFGYSLTAVTSE